MCMYLRMSHFIEFVWKCLFSVLGCMGISIFSYTHEDGLENFVLSPRICRDSLFSPGNP